MQQHRLAFETLDVHIVVVTFEPAARARHYVDENEVPGPVLVDETRELYRAYGMLSGRFWDIWGPSTWWAYLKELATGRVPAASDSDVLQLGGDVLIDPHGIVRLHHVGRGPADRPSIDALLDARQTADR